MTNREKLQKLPAETGCDALFLTSGTNRHYATGFRSSAGVALITGDTCWFFTDFRYIEAAREAVSGFEVVMVDSAHSYTDLVNDIVRDRGIKTLGFEDGTVSYAAYRRYTEKIPVSFIGVQERIEALRAVKEPAELDLMRKAQRIADNAFSDLLKVLRAGMTEREVAAEIGYLLQKNGGEKTSFDTIAVSGPNSSMPHGVPGDRRLQNGDFLTMDFGCVYHGYCSDMTRTVAIGEATEEMRKVYDTVLEAQLAGIAAVRAGITGREVDAAARGVIEAQGYGEYFGHGFGHALGLEVHESPSASPSGNTALERGMVLSAEPGIYLPGKFGVRIEDVVIVEENGCENITNSKKELLIL